MKKGSGPIRVATVIGKWNGYGVETLLSELAGRIDPERVRLVFVVDSDSRATATDRVVGLGHEVAMVAPYTRVLRHHADLMTLFRDQSFDIVHAHTSTLAGLSLSAARAAGVPVRIAHVHTTSSRSEYLKSAAKQLMKPSAAAFATHLGMSSREAGRWMFGERALRSKPALYLPVARNLDRFAFSPDVRRRIRRELDVEECTVIGHFGRFVPQKNHDFLLRVFASAREQDPRTILVLAGDGPLEASVSQKAAALGIADSVRFLGRRSDPHELMQALDAFVLPSLYEGVPGTGIEAQANGLPFLFSSAITDEAAIAPNAIRIPLSSGAEYWAREVLSAAAAGRSQSGSTLLREAGYGLEGAADRLVTFYESCTATSDAIEGA